MAMFGMYNPARSRGQILVAWLVLFGAFEIRIELFVTVCTKSVFQWIRCTAPRPFSQFKSCWHICVLVTYDMRDSFLFKFDICCFPPKSVDHDQGLPINFWFRSKQRKEVMKTKITISFRPWFPSWSRSNYSLPPTLIAVSSYISWPWMDIILFKRNMTNQSPINVYSSNQPNLIFL